MRVEAAHWDDRDVQRLAAEQQAEVRSRYDGAGESGTPPSAADIGVAKSVLAALEEAARERGWTTLRLETGPRQPEAIGLYTAAGYRPIAAFGAYICAPDAEDSLFFERILDPS